MAFDAMLLAAARDAGAEIFQPARCEQIEPKITVRNLESNEVVTLHASHILLADGKRALSANRPAPTNDLGMKAHFENVDAPRDAIELFGVYGHYGGVAAIEGGRWNVAFSVPKQRVADHAGDIDEIFAEMLNENRSLRQRFGAAKRVSPWLTSPLPRFAPPHDLCGSTIPIGNAAAAIEPIGGEGMGLAMRSAEIAAKMLLSGSRDTLRLTRSFQDLWRSRRFGCRAAAMIVSRPRMMNLLSPAIGHVEILQRGALRCIGKTTQRSS
jgi:2-polyprenyl-6-methoxyphenol hydroxylase-like FAD-dependent oxidoreductase